MPGYSDVEFFGVFRVSAIARFRVYPKASIVVPYCGSDLESYQLIPKRNYYGASGYYSRSPKVGNPIASILQSNV